MNNFFKASKEQPYHLSIGVLLVNEKGEICCHYYPDGLPYESGDEGDLYLLMRETPHEGESVEEVVHRGIKEEFGARGEIKHFIGAINAWFPGVKTGVKIYKTTIYFLVTLESFNENLRDSSDVESSSTIKWIKPQELRNIFYEQGKKYERTDLDESMIIDNYLNITLGAI